MNMLVTRQEALELSETDEVSSAIGNFADSHSTDDAVELIRAVMKAEREKPTPPEQEDEPVGFISEYGLRLIKEREDIGTTVSIFNRNTSAHTIPIYTRPQSDEIRKVGENDTDRFERLREAVEEVWETYDKTDPIQIQGSFFHAIATVRQSLKK